MTLQWLLGRSRVSNASGTSSSDGERLHQRRLGIVDSGHLPGKFVAEHGAFRGPAMLLLSLY